MDILKIDYHLHLEEGPYSPNWLKRTFEAVNHLDNNAHPSHSREWMLEQTKKLHKRLMSGPFSMDWLDLYLQQAKNLGIQEVGIVDHLYRFKEYKAYYEKHIHLKNDELGNLQRKWLDQVCVESIDEFIALIENAKQKWEENGVKLRLGIEADYFLDGEQELQEILENQPYDYVIGSVHFLNGWGFDNPETQDLFLNYDLSSLYDEFFHVVEKAISSKLFDFVAHLDNLKVFGYRPDEEILIPAYRRIAERLVETHTATEINAGLYYRYPIKEMCPSPTFLKVLAEYEVQLTVSSDAHYPDDLGKFAQMQLEILQSVGINEVITFAKREKMKHPIETTKMFKKNTVINS